MPFRVLLEDGAVCSRCEIGHSPTVFAVDSRGPVLGQGWMTPPDFWDAVAALASSNRAAPVEVT